ncbi:MAG: phenylalanine--tRNA ligase subunit beta [Bacteroidales bacterium]|nr:phenylalanine--tRNA ligase subunit beta [Bacteroidales bacterium]
MKISYNWLRNYIDLKLSPEETALILNSLGLEVEAMEGVQEIPGGLAGVVVGKVMECRRHPDADRLTITKVDTGSGELLNIVCGAPNVAEGQKVLVATTGTVLNTSGGGQLKIKRSKIRGEESNGMICAEDELGIGGSHEGILVLPEDAVPGTPAADFLKLENDTIFEIGLTPNRIDAASHIGVARDLSAYLRLNGREGEIHIPSADDSENLPKSVSGIKPAGIEVVTKTGAPRYCGITMDNITVKESPSWLKKYLTATGIRPINNVVDITNFVLLEVGHPLHAFDYNKIEGGKVVVREALPKEKIVTLDGVSRELSTEDIMICDTVKPMCIGGIFGGAGSGITEETVAIFLESAWFNPVSIRKSSKRHGLKTDASFRYERGADPEILHYALKRAAILLNELAGARVAGAIMEHYPEPFKRAEITLDIERIMKFIGKDIGRETVIKILGYLDFKIISSGEREVRVMAPLYRVDVTRECDVVEELLRIYGYDNVELPARVTSSINTTPRPDPERLREQTCDLLASNGFFEIMNNSLTKADYYVDLKSFPYENLVRIINPLSSDLNSMRQTLVLNALEVVIHNINRQRTDLRLFELGNVYSFDKGSGTDNLSPYREEMKLSVTITGKGGSNWREGDKSGGFFMLKGYVELLLARFGISPFSLSYSPAPSDLFKEGMTLSTNSGKIIAVIGSVSGVLLRKFGIKQEVFVAELDWKNFSALVKKQKVLYREVPRFPEVKRDLALLIDKDVTYSALREAAFATEKKILRQVALFDVYTGDKIPEGKKQYALSFILQDEEKTLTDKYVEDVMKKLLDSFTNRFGATLR